MIRETKLIVLLVFINVLLVPAAPNVLNAKAILDSRFTTMAIFVIVLMAIMT